MFDGEGDRLFLRVAENLVSEDWSGSVVHVEDDVSGISNSFDRSSNEGFTSRRENLIRKRKKS